MKYVSPLSTLLWLALLSHSAPVAAGATEGKGLFDSQCSNCHTTVAGKNGFGPSLAEVIGRPSGGLADYHYSTAMANAGLIWNETTLRGAATVFGADRALFASHNLPIGAGL